MYTTADFLYDLMLVGIAYGYVLLMIMIPVFLKKKDLISKFVARKMVHLFAGLVVLIVPFFIMPYYAIFIALSLTVVVYFSSKDSSVKMLKDLYESIGEEEEEDIKSRLLKKKRSYLQGPFHYCFSITLLVTIFVIFAPHQLYFPIAGILIMIISDTLASMVGKRIGKMKIKVPWVRTERTLEGSLTFFVSALILCFLSFYTFGLVSPNSQQQLSFETIIFYSFITAALGTVIELLSPSTWDDLTVPIATTFIIFLLTFI